MFVARSFFFLKVFSKGFFETKVFLNVFSSFFFKFLFFKCFFFQRFFFNGSYLSKIVFLSKVGEFFFSMDFFVVKVFSSARFFSQCFFQKEDFFQEGCVFCFQGGCVFLLAKGSCFFSWQGFASFFLAKWLRLSFLPKVFSSVQGVVVVSFSLARGCVLFLQSVGFSFLQRVLFFLDFFLQGIVFVFSLQGLCCLSFQEDVFSSKSLCFFFPRRFFFVQRGCAFLLQGVVSSLELFFCFATDRSFFLSTGLCFFFFARGCFFLCKQFSASGCVFPIVFFFFLFFVFFFALGFVFLVCMSFFFFIFCLYFLMQDFFTSFSSFFLIK